MAAHSACDFGGGKAERLALAKYRSVVWQGRVSNALLSDKELRDKGKCPMTPEEVGIMLAALGFGPETHVYLASYTVSIQYPTLLRTHDVSGSYHFVSLVSFWCSDLLHFGASFAQVEEPSLSSYWAFRDELHNQHCFLYPWLGFVLDLLQVYGGSARMEFLRTLFPGMETKHTLATAEELQPFEGKASQLAAIDYLVSLQSDIFMSASRGNMHNSLVRNRSQVIGEFTVEPFALKQTYPSIQDYTSILSFQHLWLDRVNSKDLIQLCTCALNKYFKLPWKSCLSNVVMCVIAILSCMLNSILMFVHVFVLQAAHRTYLNVRKTIKPDMNLMARLFANKNLTWPEFRRSVIEGHRNRMGQVTLRQPTQSIYTYPAPDCMCTTRRSIAEIQNWKRALDR
jgi:hypothetical protein